MESIFMLMSSKAMNKAIANYFKTQPVLKAWIFGSFARVEERPDSDVDILVAYDDSSDVSLFGETNHCGMRHILVHGYAQISDMKLWRAVAKEFPVLHQFVSKWLT